MWYVERYQGTGRSVALYEDLESIAWIAWSDADADEKNPNDSFQSLYIPFFFRIASHLDRKYVLRGFYSDEARSEPRNGRVQRMTQLAS
jgi:hypothetical protein